MSVRDTLPLFFPSLWLSVTTIIARCSIYKEMLFVMSSRASSHVNIDVYWHMEIDVWAYAKTHDKGVYVRRLEAVQ